MVARGPLQCAAARRAGQEPVDCVGACRVGNRKSREAGQGSDMRSSPVPAALHLGPGSGSAGLRTLPRGLREAAGAVLEFRGQPRVARPWLGSRAPPCVEHATPSWRAGAQRAVSWPPLRAACGSQPMSLKHPAIQIQSISAAMISSQCNGCSVTGKFFFIQGARTRIASKGHEDCLQPLRMMTPSENEEEREQSSDAYRWSNSGNTHAKQACAQKKE